MTDATADSVLTDVETDRGRRLAWQRRLTEFAESARRAVAAHPAVIPLLLTHRHGRAELLAPG